MRLQATQEELVLVALAEGVPAHARVFDCVLYIADVTGMRPEARFCFCLCLFCVGANCKRNRRVSVCHCKPASPSPFPPYFIFCISG